MGDAGKTFSVSTGTITAAGIIVILLVAVLNLFLTVNLANNVNSLSGQLAALKAIPSLASAGAGSPSPSDAQNIELIAAEVVATGVPAVYGNELSVSFDRVQDGINKLSPYDRGIELQGANLQKYINVTTKISCEYCCSAKAIAFSDGSAACACAHSAAMRGLAKYLIKNHNNEFSEGEILGELQKWKSVFFPKQTIAKAVQEKTNGGGSSGTALASLPDMVGGC